jgi:uncharacterized protein (TIGR02996 family)
VPLSERHTECAYYFEPAMSRVRPLFPDPVCKLPDEYGFVAAVLAAPLDDLPKLVYADWLEERNDPRGAFLRAWLAARKARKKLPKPDKKLSKCWLSVVGFTLDEWLARQFQPEWGDTVRAIAEPCVGVRTVPLADGETVPTGMSKMGGLPDLDPIDLWPTTSEDEQNEMAFVAQWNLAELSVSPCCSKLPKKGLLSFFIDLVPFVEDSGDGSSEVVFHPDPEKTDEREPDEQAEESSLPACRVEFREWLSIPDFRSPAVKRLKLPAEVLSDYSVRQFDYTTPKGQHKILGHADTIQNDPTPTGKKAWSLLTQFGPDGDLRLEACDGGTWYFMTPTADLKKGKFDDTEMEFQTG